MIMHRPDPAAAIRSLRSRGALHPHVQGQDLRREGRRRRVRRRRPRCAASSSRSPSCITSACAWCSCTAAARSSRKSPRQLGVPTRMVQGRRVTDQKAIDATSMVLNGLINTKLLALCREMNIDAVGISGVDAGLIRAHKRAPVKTRQRRDRRLRLRGRHRRHRHHGASPSCSTTASCRSSARCRPMKAARCSTSTATPWPRPSARRSRPRS